MAAAPEAPAPPDQPIEQQATAWGDDFVMRTATRWPTSLVAALRDAGRRDA